MSPNQIFSFMKGRKGRHELDFKMTPVNCGETEKVGIDFSSIVANFGVVLARIPKLQIRQLETSN